MATRVPFKNINMMTKEQYNGVGTLAADSLYAISGSGISLPSNRYIDLTLGATAARYTAPGNGYFYVGKASSAAGQYLDMFNTTSKYRLQGQAVAVGSYCLVTIPARKGDVVQVNYNLAGVTEGFRFIYAEGE